MVDHPHPAPPPCGWCIIVVRNVGSNHSSVFGTTCTLISTDQGQGMLHSLQTTFAQPADGTTVLDAALQSSCVFSARILQAAPGDSYYAQLVAHCTPGSDLSADPQPARLLHAHLDPMHRPLPVRTHALADLALPAVLRPTLDAARWR